MMSKTDRDRTPSGRPRARPPLSRETILDAAREIVSRAGFDALTMRQVASALGSGAMTLYTYFRGRDDLVTALLDELLGTIELEPADVEPQDWRDHLRRVMRAHRAMLHRYPSAVPYFLAIPMNGPRSMRFVEAVLTVLRRAGLTDEAAIGSFFTLLALNYGFVSFEAHRRQPGASEEQIEERTRPIQVALASLSEREFPLTVALARPLARFALTDAQYVFALDLVIAGIAHQGQGVGTPPR